jgi:cytochrome c oxidase subunit 4
LANIEASWKDLASEEQYEVYQQLETLQKKDWKELSVDEKKAGEFFWRRRHGCYLGGSS